MFTLVLVVQLSIQNRPILYNVDEKMNKLVFRFPSCRTTLRRAHRAVEFALTLGEEGSYVDANIVDIKHHSLS